jgi:hypothetical protein
MTIPKPIRWILIGLSLALAARTAVWHLHEPHALWKLFQFGVVNPVLFSGMLDAFIFKKQ